MLTGVLVLSDRNRAYNGLLAGDGDGDVDGDGEGEKGGENPWSSKLIAFFRGIGRYPAALPPPMSGGEKWVGAEEAGTGW